MATVHLDLWSGEYDDSLVTASCQVTWGVLSIDKDPLEWVNETLQNKKRYLDLQEVLLVDPHQVFDGGGGNDVHRTIWIPHRVTR